MASYGMSGNFVFSSSDGKGSSLERRIADAFGVAAFLKGRRELDEIVAADPYRDEPGASMFLTHRALEPEQTAVLKAQEFGGKRPLAHGSVVYFVHPTRVKGRRSVIDFEGKLGVEGTMRASRVVERVLNMMQAGGV